MQSEGAGIRAHSLATIIMSEENQKMEWIVFCVGLILIFVLGTSYYAYRKTFHSEKKPRKRQDYMDEGIYSEVSDRLRGWAEDLARVPFEEVYIRSADGKRLFGRYYHVADGAPINIEFHGYRGDAYRDFSGGDPFSRRKGCNTLLVDQRAHGKSGGRTITFGVKERLDVLAWVEYAVNRFGDSTRIFLTGISMGAATVLMATELPLPANVVGVIADSPYSSPRDIIRKVCGDMHLPVDFIYPFLWLGALLFGHFRIRGGAEDAVKRATMPLLILHGEGDGFVPCSMSERIAEEASDATLVTFAGADHCLGYVVAPEKYEETLSAFLDKCLKKSA